MQSEREVAVRGLMEILEKNAYGNLALRRILSSNEGLNRQQKAFVTEIVSGCIRNLILLDHIINKTSNTPTSKMKPAILNILRASVYQMVFMDKVPVFAICSEGTDLAKKFGFKGLSGFVNGVLRNISRGLNDIALPDFETEPLDYLKVKYSCQQWIAEHFVQELGLEVAKELLDSVSAPPRTTLCVNTNKIGVEELREILTGEGLDVADGAIVENCLTVTKTADLAALPSFKKGFYHVMDEAAALAVKCATTGPNARIIDICAAPGGKSFALAYATPGAKILSRDIHDFKLNLIKQSAKRLGLDNIEVQAGDAAKFDRALQNTADLLVVDAPCTGLGTLRRRPDIKLGKPQSSIADLAALQRKILAASWQYVRPGGKLLYLTCTISRAENLDNRNWLLKNFPLRPVDFSAQMPDFSGLATAKEGYVQILPQYFGTDGFFIAVFERVGE